MKTLATNSNNDIFLVGNGLAMAEGERCQAVIVDSMIKTQTGEIEEDEEFGVDYAGTIMLNRTFDKLWASQVSTKVKSLPWVKEVKKFEYKFIPETDTLEWSMLIENRDGGEVVVGSSREMRNGSVISVNKSWDAIRDKPVGIEDVIKTVHDISIAAGNKKILTRASTRADVKEVVNDVMIRPLSQDGTDS